MRPRSRLARRDAPLGRGAIGRDPARLRAPGGDDAEVADLVALADALAPSRERRAEALGQGTAFAIAVRAEGLDVPDAALPVALGRAARLAGLPALPVALVHLQATGRRSCRRRSGSCRSARRRRRACWRRSLGWRSGRGGGGGAHAPTTSAPRALAFDAASMRHETLEPRIFRS